MTIRTPGSAARRAASAACAKAAMAEIGSAMSCLTALPARTCACEMPSRIFQNACVWATLTLTATSCTVSCASASPRPDSSSSARPASWVSANSMSAWKACAPASGARTSATCARISASEAADIISKATRRSPQAARSPASRSTRASMSRAPTQAVARATGRGCSLSTAAVMTPSVPSEPMNRSRRS